ncbi:hypothetical protein PIB30_030396 [Stylosanthes scabra]|uniref:Glycolipid transfer protein domain-containing protein n=1 Tax=Stylosanthes scabra TaxID=79078 RepID=A0ABU6YA77_9FABA|nr:hypothetical protein [Stylosanthes scabra]
MVAGEAFRLPLEELGHVKSKDGKILTKPFLNVCKSVLPVLDMLGRAFSFVKSDVGGNISRLECRYETNPCEYKLLYRIVEKEIEDKTHKSSSSCTNALLWLTRGMDYSVQMFSNLEEHKNWSMQEACNDSYSKTLRNWHGWIAIQTFHVAMRLLPDRKKFMQALCCGGEFGPDDMKKFCTDFSSVLEENHKFLASIRMDDLKA